MGITVKVFINGNNSVRTRSSLRGNDLGWWLATVNGPRLRLGRLRAPATNPVLTTQ